MFVDSRCRTFYDRDNKLLTEAEIKFKTKFGNNFENPNFRNFIFGKCNLRETMPFGHGRMTRAEHLNYKNETGWR